jgi:hypothetical protein
MSGLVEGALQLGLKSTKLQAGKETISWFCEKEKRIMGRFSVFLACAFLCSTSGYAADRALYEAARGAAIADFTVEKCTGRKMSDDIMSKQMRFLVKQGLSSDEVAKAFQVGLWQVESEYAGGARPPKSECAQAQMLYNEFLKNIK